jgi:hypothetical protein
MTTCATDDTLNPVPVTVYAEPTEPCNGFTAIVGFTATVNVPVAVWPPTSVAVTVVPDVPLGTSNAQLNAPVPLAVSEPLVQAVTMTIPSTIVTESKTSDATGINTEKPVPDTVTVDPTGPRVGLSVIAGVVTANVAAAVWPPASVAVTVVPDVPPGTANVQLNAPVPPVVSEPVVHAAIVTESKTSECSGVETEKPVPDTVTVDPTGPWVGFTVIAGLAVTVNVTETIDGAAPFTVTLPVDAPTVMW